MLRLNKILVLLLIVMFLTNNFIEMRSVKANVDWGQFDVRTSMPSNVTAEHIRKEFERVGRTNSPFYSRIEWIIKEAEDYGINPLYILAKLNLESSWGTSDLARNNNNFGGMKAKGGGYQKFQDVESGIRANIALVHKYTSQGIVTASNPSGKPLVKIKEVLNSYCPESDGCNHYNYINSISNMMVKFGQTITGDLMQANASGSELNAKENEIRDVGGRKVPLDAIYQDRNIIKNHLIGVNTAEMSMGSEVRNWFHTFSEDTYKWLLRLGWLLSFALIGYVSLYLLTFLVLPYDTRVKKLFTNKMIEAGEQASLMGLGGIWIMLKHSIVALILMFLFGTGLYIPIMALLYRTIELWIR